MIRIHVNTASAVAALGDLRTSQGPYLVSLTLNRVALDGQAAERARIKGSFKLRQSNFTLQGVYIGPEDRATKAKPSVVIRVEAKRSYLEKFEEGGEKVPIGGRRYLAIPDPSVFKRRTLKADNPLRPKNLHLHKDPHGRIIGDQRTFVVPTANGQQAIMQRVARRLVVSGKASLSRLTLDNFADGMGPRTKKERYSTHRTDGVRRLFSLVRRVKVDARLEFADTIRGAVQAKLQERFAEAFMQTVRTAR